MATGPSPASLVTAQPEVGDAGQLAGGVSYCQYSQLSPCLLGPKTQVQRPGLPSSVPGVMAWPCSLGPWHAPARGSAAGSRGAALRGRPGAACLCPHPHALRCWRGSAVPQTWAWQRTRQLGLLSQEGVAHMSPCRAHPSGGPGRHPWWGRSVPCRRQSGIALLLTLCRPAACPRPWRLAALPVSARC